MTSFATRPGATNGAERARRAPGGATTKPPRRRRSPGWVPNQHGAWAMLSAPLLVGILASRPSLTHLALTAFWFTGYFAFYATGLWLKAPPRRRPKLRTPALTYATASSVFGLMTLALDPGLVRWAPLFALPLGVGLWSSWKRDERSLLSGVSTTVGSCLMTLVAYDAGGGTDWTRAWILTAILAGYFAGTVLYIKTIIRQRGHEGYLWLSMLAHCLMTVAMIPISPWLVLVFAALTIRAAIVPAFKVTAKASGMGEIASTLAVALTALLTT